MPTVKSIAATRLAVLKSPFVWAPALILATLTLVFWSTNLDVATSRLFFSGDGVAVDKSLRFPLGEMQPWKAIHDWGEYPAFWFGCCGLALWIVSFVWRRLEPWRDPGLFFALVLIVGPGILVNCVFKPYWSRPRPHAVKDFKDSDDPRDPPRDFVPVWHRGDGTADSSFPSGHAAMGFYWMSPAFVCYRRRRRLAIVFLIVGLTAGCLIGSARIVAGGHFLSDIVWAGGIMYYTALLLAVPFRFSRAAA
jgi:lipid A 4'-phosphatase